MEEEEEKEGKGEEGCLVLDEWERAVGMEEVVNGRYSMATGGCCWRCGETGSRVVEWVGFGVHVAGIAEPAEMERVAMGVCRPRECASCWRWKGLLAIPITLHSCWNSPSSICLSRLTSSTPTEHRLSNCSSTFSGRIHCSHSISHYIMARGLVGVNYMYACVQAGVVQVTPA